MTETGWAITFLLVYCALAGLYLLHRERRRRPDPPAPVEPPAETLAREARQYLDRFVP